MKSIDDLLIFGVLDAKSTIQTVLTASKIVATDASGKLTVISGTNAQFIMGDGSLVSALDPSKITQSASYRFVSDAEKATWNGKMNTDGSNAVALVKLSSGSEAGSNSETKIVTNLPNSITTNSPGTNACFTNAIDFRWYSTHWQIGGIRDVNGTGTNGFGIALNGTNLRWRVTNGTTYDYNNLEVTGTIKGSSIVFGNASLYKSGDSAWIHVGGSGLIPAVNGTQSLGFDSFRYAQVHSNAFYESGVLLSSKYFGINSLVDPAKIDVGYTANRFYLNTHPEGNGVIIPFINNDLAHLTKRGGSMISYYTTDSDFTALTLTNTGAVAIDTTAPFDGSPSYAGFTIASVNSVVVIDITCTNTFSCGNVVYIDFGTAAWSAKNISIYAFNDSANQSETVYKLFGAGSIVNNTTGRFYVNSSYSYTNTSATTSQGFNKLRFVLTNYSNTVPRIACIGVIAYNSSGLNNVYLSRAGGDMHGTIQPSISGGANLGSNPLRWQDVHANNYYESGTLLVNKYAAKVHSHVIGDVTGLQAALDAKQASLGFTPVNKAGDSSIGTLTTADGNYIRVAKNTTLDANAYVNAALIVERVENAAPGTFNAGIGFHNRGQNAAYLYYDRITGHFGLQQNSVNNYTIWDSGNLVGNQTGHTHSQYLTGNQSITLTGVVTGSGTTTIATAIADAALTVAKTNGLQTALDSKLNLTGGNMSGPIVMGSAGVTSTSTRLTSRGYLFDAYAGIEHFNSTTKSGVGGTLGAEDGPFIYGYAGVALGYSSAGTTAGHLVAALRTSGVNVLVQGTISEAGTLLSARYLGLTAKAADSDKLDGMDGSYFVQGSATSRNQGLRTTLIHSSTANPDFLSPSGYYDGSFSSGMPQNGWWLINRMKHSDPSGAGTTMPWGVDFAGAMTSGNIEQYCVRVSTDSAWGVWRTLWHSGDFASTNITNWETAYARVIASRIAVDCYQNDDATLWATRAANNGNHFGRYDNTSVPAMPRYFNYVMLREASSTLYGAFGYSSDGQWYVGKASIGAEITGLSKLWHSGNFDIGRVSSLETRMNGVDANWVNYHPLENQRLSTGNAVNFYSVSLGTATDNTTNALNIGGSWIQGTTGSSNPKSMIIRADEIRFANIGSNWDWNAWAGLKYNGTDIHFGGNYYGTFNYNSSGSLALINSIQFVGIKSVVVDSTAGSSALTGKAGLLVGNYSYWGSSNAAALGIAVPSGYTPWVFEIDVGGSGVFCVDVLGNITRVGLLGTQVYGSANFGQVERWALANDYIGLTTEQSNTGSWMTSGGFFTNGKNIWISAPMDLNVNVAGNTSAISLTGTTMTLGVALSGTSASMSGDLNFSGILGTSSLSGTGETQHDYYSHLCTLEITGQYGMASISFELTNGFNPGWNTAYYNFKGRIAIKHQSLMSASLDYVTFTLDSFVGDVTLIPRLVAIKTMDSGSSKQVKVYWRHPWDYDWGSRVILHSPMGNALKGSFTVSAALPTYSGTWYATWHCAQDSAGGVRLHMYNGPINIDAGLTGSNSEIAFAAANLEESTGTKPFSAWGHIIEMGHYDSLWKHQIAFDYFGDHFAYRRKSNGTWHTWSIGANINTTNTFTDYNTFVYDISTPSITALSGYGRIVLRESPSTSGFSSYLGTNDAWSTFFVAQENNHGFTWLGGTTNTALAQLNSKGNFYALGSASAKGILAKWANADTDTGNVLYMGSNAPGIQIAMAAPSAGSQYYGMAGMYGWDSTGSTPISIRQGFGCMNNASTMTLFLPGLKTISEVTYSASTFTTRDVLSWDASGSVVIYNHLYRIGSEYINEGGVSRGVAARTQISSNDIGSVVTVYPHPSLYRDYTLPVAGPGSTIFIYAGGGSVIAPAVYAPASMSLRVYNSSLGYQTINAGMKMFMVIGTTWCAM